MFKARQRSREENILHLKWQSSSLFVCYTSINWNAEPSETTKAQIKDPNNNIKNNNKYCINIFYGVSPSLPTAVLSRLLHVFCEQRLQ